jgi:hypothetical protein
MVDNLLIDYLRTREIKQKAIYSQKYELAANTRDEERKLSVKLYKSLTGDKVDNFDWVKFEQSVDNYCINEYGFSIKDSYLLKQVIRQKNLKDLGI